MNLPDYWELCPDGHTHPLGGAKHAPFLAHYGRIRTFDEWVSAGFEIGRGKDGRITQRKGRSLYGFERVWGREAPEREAIATGKRHVTHFFPMLDYVRAGVLFDEFVSHPQHYRDFCLGALAQERGEVGDAIEHFRKALAADPDEVRYAERLYGLRVAAEDAAAPAEELAYFTNEIDSMIHSGRVYAWVALLLKNKDYAEAARLVRRTAQLLEEKLAGRLPKGRYSGDSTPFVAAKRDQFRKKLASWSGSRKYAPLMAEIERQGGLPEPHLRNCGE